LRVFATVGDEKETGMVSSGPLEDRLAIRELVESYNDAVMRFDAEAWAANWVDDAVWSLPGVGEVAGREKIVALWKQMMSALSFVGFYASAGPIVVTANAATATWWQQELLHGKDGVRTAIQGRYEDVYSKRSGRWYFAKRVYAVLDRQESKE
ncbi:MAG TPA: nuclear transport factor 2 family protein, partial [Myxococcota bacterium]|nr:nuclear transport factor 2 family protein [Myxococcota bacterium]